MNKKFNRKKLFSIKKKFFYKLFIFFIIIVIIFYTYKNFLKIENLLISTIENLSYNFNYTLQYYDIEGLNNIKEEDITKIIKPYINTSIFLLSLQNISNSIFENNWVKNLKLKPSQVFVIATRTCHYPNTTYKLIPAATIFLKKA